MENKNNQISLSLDSTGSLHHQLKTATAEIHHKMEGGGITARLTAQDFSRLEYASYLQKIFRFVAPLEDLLKAQISSIASFIPDLDLRWKTSKLVHDLKKIDAGNVGPRAEPKDLPAITSRAQAMGVLYVMEGSTLGGQLIRKKLLIHNFIDAENILYLTAYGENTGAMWRGMLAALAKFESEAKPEECGTTIEAAKATFQKLGSWLNRLEQ